MRDWRTFIEMVPYFQPGSAYAAALAQDDELVEAERAGQSLDGGPSQAYRPQSLGWDYTRTDLAEVKDKLSVLIAAATKSERAPEPAARPHTAIERWEKKTRQENSNWLNEKLGLPI